MRISVLGLGRMGAPMARNLIEVGHEVALYNRTRSRADGLAAKNARVAATVAEAVRDTHVALTMVSDDEAEHALTFAQDGLLKNLPSGAIHLSMSTIGMETSRQLALAHAEAGQGYVAAPVFGRPGMAVSRHLWIVAGGPDAQVARCLTIFETLGRGITRVGPRAELAHALKIGGNLLAAVMIEGLSEVLAYGEKAGMPPAQYLHLLNTAIFKSPMLDAVGGLMVRRVHDPADLPLDSALKDTLLAMRASEDLDAVMPMAELLQQRLEAASVQGWGAEDLTVLARSCRWAAGLEGNGGDEVPRKADRPPTFKARSPEGEVELALGHVTHFEIIKDAVWAWAQGKRYSTPWKHLVEVERAFGHVPFLRLHRHILLQPEAAMAAKAGPGPTPNGNAERKQEPLLPDPGEQVPVYRARTGENQVMLGLAETTHFEMEEDVVWAWVQGTRHRTFWRSLAEVESTFGHVILLRIQRNILLHPEAVISLRPSFGGRAKVRVKGGLEFDIPKAAADRLKEVLGV